MKLTKAISEPAGIEGVRTLRLCGAERLNCLSDMTFRELIGHLGDASRDASTKVVWLSGEGDKAFCAGADLEQIRGMSGPEFRAFGEYTIRLVDAIQNAGCVVIAVVRGYAYGAGAAMVMASDLAICTRDSRFAQPEILRGLLGGTALLPRRLSSRKKANEMALLGSSISGVEAESCGLVNYAVPDDELDDQLATMTRKILEIPRDALSATKQALLRGGSVANELDAFKIQQDMAALLWSTS